jgi:hypothetical protein
MESFQELVQAIVPFLIMKVNHVVFVGNFQMNQNVKNLQLILIN